MNKPEVFENSSQTNPKEWVDRYRIIAKLNKWDTDDWVDFVQLYLGKRELIWYKRNKSGFTTWDAFKTKFIEKFGPKDQGIVYFEKLKTIKQEDFESIEEMEYVLEDILVKAKITDDEQKLNWLQSTLAGNYRAMVRSAGCSDWKGTIETVSNAEQQGIQPGAAESMAKEGLVKTVEKKLQLPHMGKPIREMAEERLGYNEM
ncbi:hypothetical protein AX774_g6212, partial [Zancudomyces culisetae]